MFWYQIIITKDQSPLGDLDRQLRHTFDDLFVIFNEHKGLSMFTVKSVKNLFEIIKDFYTRNDRIYYLCFPDEINNSLLKVFGKYSPKPCEKPEASDVHQIAGDDSLIYFEY